MIRNVTIQACLNGFIVSVGCQTLAFTSVDDLTVKLAGYLRDPEKAEKEFLKDAINRRHTLGDNIPPQPETAPPLQRLRRADEAVGRAVVNATNEGHILAPDPAPTAGAQTPDTTIGAATARY